MLDDLSAQFDALQSVLKRSTAVQVSDKATKARTISLVKDYFNVYRPQLVRAVKEDLLTESDSLWQQFLQLAQSTNRRQSYLKTAKSIRRILNQINREVLTASSYEHASVE